MPQSLVTVTVNGEEYIITSIQKKFTDSNIDDSEIYYTLNVGCGGNGTIKTFNTDHN